MRSRVYRRGLLLRAQVRVRAFSRARALARQAAILPSGLGRAVLVDAALESARKVHELAVAGGRERVAGAQRTDARRAADDEARARRGGLLYDRHEIRGRRPAARRIAGHQPDAPRARRVV